MPKPAFLPDTPISEFLPMSTHVSPTVLKTTGGDFLLVWHLGGLPFVGREEWEIEHRHNTFNRMLQTLRAPDFVNVAFWVHDVRRRRRLIDHSKFGQSFNQSMSDTYHEALSTQKLMQNELYLTMLYRPMVSGKRFAEKSADVARLEAEQLEAINTILELAGNVEAVLKDYAPYRLGMYEAGNGVIFSEALEFYGYLLNRIDEPVPVLPAPVPEYLPLSKQRFSAKTGDFVITGPDGNSQFGAILNIKEYTDATYPGILNGLKYLDFEYVVTHSFSPMGRQDALKALDRTKGMMISSGDKAFSQIAELDHAMDQLASGNFVLGEYHFTMAIYATSQEALSQQIATTRAELSNAGFVSVKEDLAVTAAFYAQFPGNWKYRTRLANVSSLNFLGLSPLHNFATGKKANNPWGDCVTTLQTTNGQPYYFNFHATHPAENSLGEKAIANTMVIGKSGTGKTALINFLLSQVQKLQPSPTIFFFDKDRGAEIFVRACGGNYLALENGRPTGFNPFHCERNESNIQFLAELIKVLVGKTIYSSREEEDIFRAVENILDTPMHLRTMTNFQKSLPNMGDDGLYIRMRKWTSGNSLGWVFDNPVDTIDLEKANIIGFDYTDIIDNPEVRVPVINYLLHKLEALIDGRPLIYVMDEFWKILDGKGGLKEFAKNKQKTIRKQNGLGIFATQSPEDALASDIAASLIEQTATMILLPNPNASRDDYVGGLKLTEAEYEVVVSLDERSRCFLVKQGHASSVCQLNLQGMDDALAVISASTDNIEVMHEVLAARAAAEGVQVDALTPEQWLNDFYENRKGSGKKAANRSPAHLARLLANVEDQPMRKSTPLKIVHNLTLYKGLVLSLTLVCGMASNIAKAQVLVSDPVLEGQKAASNVTQGTQLAKQLLQYEQQIQQYTTQLEQLRNILTKIESLGSGISLLPKTLEPISQAESDQLVQQACPGASASGLLGSAMAAIESTASQPLTQSQKNICMAIVLLQVDEYNITASALSQLTLQQSTVQKLGGIVNAISTMGESSSASSQAQEYLAQLQTASITWKNQLEADEAAIKALQQHQGNLAKLALNGKSTLLGTIIQAGAFAAAFH